MSLINSNVKQGIITTDADDANAVFNTRNILTDQRDESMKLFIVCWFLGFLGIHRFMEGKIFTGILWLLTGGGFFIGWIIDDIMGAVQWHKTHKELKNFNEAVELHRINSTSSIKSK